jgi:hypothetical protein
MATLIAGVADSPRALPREVLIPPEASTDAQEAARGR